MRLLIDFGSIKTGGGVQLATNFLNFLKEYPEDVEKIYLLVPELGPLFQHINQERYDGILIYPNSYWKRKLFELTTLRKYVAENRIDVFYTFFGAGIPTPKGVSSIVSVAFPIICYPDSAFWRFLPLKLSIRQRLVDILRRRRIRMADKVIAETSIMAERLIKYVRVNPERLSILPPVPSAFIENRPYHQKTCRAKIHFLLLGSLEPHKNVWRLPAIAKALENLGFNDFVFLISATRTQFEKAYPEHHEYEDVLDLYFEFMGTIPSQDIQKVYDQADFLLNLSDLESFSNNYMEAWKAGLPLICSDTDFARHICEKSAIYVDPHNTQTAAETICHSLKDPKLQKQLTEEGKKLLAKLPTIEQKFARIMQIIRETC